MKFTSPAVLIAIATALNLLTIYAIDAGDKLRPFWAWPTVVIALTIVPVQYLLAVASRDKNFPIDVAIAVLIACVLTFAALLDGRRHPERPVSWWAVGFYGVMIVCALAAGVAKSRAGQLRGDARDSGAGEILSASGERSASRRG